MTICRSIFLGVFFLFYSRVWAYPELDIKKLENWVEPMAVQKSPALVHAFHELIDQQYTTNQMLGKSELYIPIIQDTFKAYNIPPVLAYAAPSFSKFNSWRVSEDGGSGFWQMRYIIAKNYGLKINSYVDERRHFQKSLSVAAKELKTLFLEFNSWELALLAFQTGSVEVNKAIRKANGSTNYSEIEPFLLARYQKFIPRFLACVFVHHQEKTVLNLTPMKYENTPQDTVYLSQWCTVYQLSQALKVEFDQLKNLNPVYKKQVIPFAGGASPFVIPSSSVNRFYNLGDSVYSFQNAEPSFGKVPVAEPTEVAEVKTQSTKSKNQLLYYTVKKGDYLGKVADLYDVGVSDVRRWNNIKGDNIQINQRLKIYKSSKVSSNYKGINGMSAAQKQRLINKD